MYENNYMTYFISDEIYVTTQIVYIFKKYILNLYNHIDEMWNEIMKFSQFILSLNKLFLFTQLD